MSRKFLIAVLIFQIGILGISCSQSKKMFDVKSPAKGVILRKEVNLYLDEEVNWFEPTIQEVQTAEKLLSKAIIELNKDQINQGTEACPVIDQNLNKYIRQYIGYVNSNGERIILINMIWHKENYGDLSQEYNLIFDGCSRFWKVKINLNNKTVYDLQINGKA